MSDNYNTLLKDGKFYKAPNENVKGAYTWEPAFNLTGEKTLWFATKKEGLGWRKKEKKKPKRLHDSAEWLKKNRPEHWERVKERALDYTRKVKGITLHIEAVEREFGWPVSAVEIYSRYHQEHGISLRQANVYAGHLKRRARKGDENEM